VVNNAADRLDADELLHLALNAAQANRHEEAINSLKRALDLSPNDARTHYLLGAEHAQIGLYDRAVEEISKAVELDPKLNTARFQLGLLHLTSARVDQAESAWAPLDDLKVDDPLRLFKTGLLHLARDEFEQCAANLKKGIALNRENPTLNKDMQQVLATLDQREAATTKDAVSRQTAKPATPKSGRVLTAYRNRTEGKE
jgi:Flp pilus assembly protein TadD